MESLFKKHRMLISQVSTDIIRESANTVLWGKQLVGIKGSKGVGKTTMMRQFIKKHYGVTAGEALYCVMDSIYFATHSLLQLAEEFHLLGGKHLFLDEVHKYNGWSTEIKEIIDLYPDMRITYSGSSLLQIINSDADLSRRSLSYNIPGLSFREYLMFYHGIKFPKYSLEELLNKSDEICDTVTKVCSPQKMFNEYLRVGFYPFYSNDKTEYYSRIENVVSYIIEQEMTKFCGVDPAYTRKLKAMLLYLADSIPYEVNIVKLASYLEINKITVLNYLASMDKAELIHLLYADNKNVTRMQKPDKIFIHNPNILCALARNENIGTLRECFFVNQMMVDHEVEYSKNQGDFLIDGKWTIEVGGPDKTFNQIADIPNSFVFADSLDFPVGKKLPLWLAGFVY